MVRIRAGEFVMGHSSNAISLYQNDEAEHRVLLTHNFYMGTTEVTQGLWRAVMGNNPASGKSYKGYSLEGEDFPVINVSWLDAVRFANRLSMREGLEACYEVIGDRVRWPKGPDCKGYRLPTEAEWEYAARAAITQERYTDNVFSGTYGESSLCQYANVADLSAIAKFQWSRYGDRPCRDHHIVLAPVGSYEPNAWRLYDLSGNVYEWCWDKYGATYGLTDVTKYGVVVADPLGPSDGSSHVLRGGSWYNNLSHARVYNRYWFEPSHTTAYLGFRLVRSI